MLPELLHRSGHDDQGQHILTGSNSLRIEDKRPELAVTQWLQFCLDNFETLNENL